MEFFTHPDFIKVIPLFVLVVLPIAGWILEFYVQIITRDRIKIYWVSKILSYEYSLFSKIKNVERWRQVGYPALTVVVNAVLGVLLGCIIQDSPDGGFSLLIGFAATVALVVIPRAFLDVTHSLKFSFKERECKRIHELENQVDTLLAQISKKDK